MSRILFVMMALGHVTHAADLSCTANAIDGKDNFRLNRVREAGYTRFVVIRTIGRVPNPSIDVRNFQVTAVHRVGDITLYKTTETGTIYVGGGTVTADFTLDRPTATGTWLQTADFFDGSTGRRKVTRTLYSVKCGEDE